MVANRTYAAGQIADLAEKLEQAEQQLTHGGHHRMAMQGGAEKKAEEPLARVCKDCTKLATEQGHGLISLVMKDILFNFKAEAPKTPTAAK